MKIRTFGLAIVAGCLACERPATPTRVGVSPEDLTSAVGSVPQLKVTFQGDDAAVAAGEISSGVTLTRVADRLGIPLSIDEGVGPEQTGPVLIFAPKVPIEPGWYEFAIPVPAGTCVVCDHDDGTPEERHLVRISVDSDPVLREIAKCSMATYGDEAALRLRFSEPVGLAAGASVAGVVAVSFNGVAESCSEWFAEDPHQQLLSNGAQLNEWLLRCGSSGDLALRVSAEAKSAAGVPVHLYGQEGAGIEFTAPASAAKRDDEGCDVWPLHRSP